MRFLYYQLFVYQKTVRDCSDLKRNLAITNWVQKGLVFKILSTPFFGFFYWDTLWIFCVTSNGNSQERDNFLQVILTFFSFILPRVGLKSRSLFTGTEVEMNRPFLEDNRMSKIRHKYSQIKIQIDSQKATLDSLNQNLTHFKNASVI